jgi:hypothetical protein
MYLFCQQCGARLETTFSANRHECDFEQLLEFQTQCARIEIENGLEAQLAAWEREPRLANRLAFARYMRDRSQRSAPFVARRAA